MTVKQIRVRINCPLCENYLIKTNFKNKEKNYFVCMFCKKNFTTKDLRELYSIDLKVYNKEILESKNELYWILKAIMLFGLVSITLVLTFSIFR